MTNANAIKKISIEQVLELLEETYSFDEKTKALFKCKYTFISSTPVLINELNCVKSLFTQT